MLKWIVSLLAISSTAHSNSIDIQRSEIDYYQGQIIVDYRLTFSADPAKVKELLTDYENFPALSRLIKKSHVSYENENKILLHQELIPCVLGFCYMLTKEQQLFTNKNGSVSAVFIPKQKYFLGGLEEWTVSSNELGTTIQYKANVTPSFPMPPFLGTWLIRKFIDAEIKSVAKHILLKCG